MPFYCSVSSKVGGFLIDDEQIIEVRLNKNNRDYYKSKGYEISDNVKLLPVKVFDLNRNSKYKVHVKCDICGKENNITLKDYNNNVERNHGTYVCHSCSIQVRHNKTLQERQKHYMEQLEKICKENGYQLLSKQNEIVNNMSYIKYSCPKHGVRSIRIANMLFGERCPQCASDLKNQQLKLSTDEVISRVSSCGGELLNPEDYINNSICNLKFKCSNCGKIFVSSMQRFMQHGGQLCRTCSKKESLGEVKIRQYLESKNIKFEQQRWFPDCKDIRPLPFDFFLPDLNMIIEFDGRQHFQDTSYFSYPLTKVQYHDEIKNDYCRDNNISLLRIPYTQINHIDEILNKNLFT